jgi:hypothetical protein
MIDAFSLGLTHGLMLLAALILIGRRSLDDENPQDAAPTRDRWGRKRA